MEDNNNQNEYPHLEPESNEHHHPQGNEFRSPRPRPKVCDNFTLIDSGTRCESFSATIAKHVSL